jgi:hypothetical protein
MDNPLGRLKKVDLRGYWKDEARDFTPWLTKEDNLELLSETLGLQIEIESTEIPIGNYRADIIARDVNSERTIIIENQVEKTNHDHLGKIITYASGIGAEIVIWICNVVTDEHRNAIDWLNEISNEQIAFFALEIELWKIGESPPAPKFNIVCSPNEWAKTVKESSGKRSPTETKLLQKEFWESLKEHMERNKTFLSLRKPRPQHWYNLAVGRTGFSIALTANTVSKKLGCEIYIRGENAKKAYQLLLKNKEDIEEEIQDNLDWQELPDGQDSRIVLYSDGDIRQKEKWGDYFVWFNKYSERFHKAFSDRIQSLSL